MGSASAAAVKDEAAAEESGGGGAGGDAKKDTGPFREGEKVLAYHGPLIYEAKIQKTEFRKEWKYFVHYLGWSKTWDEWVGSERLMKLTEPNLEKQRKLFKTQQSSRSRVPAGKQKGLHEKEEGKQQQQQQQQQQQEPPKPAVTRGKKRKSDAVSSAEVKDAAAAEEPEQVLKIVLPGTLKKQLVDDWEFVTHMGKTIELPRNPTADQILKKYIESKTKRDGVVEDALMEVLNGLRTYFDKALPAMLLYPQERAQFATAIPPGSNANPSTIYGAEHFLRLFVKLPELLVYTNMEQEALVHLQQKLTDFLKFLQRNQTSFFLSSYG
jgi:mortality factor 4-like protein 1